MKKNTDADNGSADDRLLTTPFADFLAEANKVDLDDHTTLSLMQEDKILDEFELVEEFIVPLEIRRIIVVLERDYCSLKELLNEFHDIAGGAEVAGDIPEGVRDHFFELQDRYQAKRARILIVKDFICSLIAEVNPGMSELAEFAIGPDWGVYSWPVQECCGKRHGRQEKYLENILRDSLDSGIPLEISVEEVGSGQSDSFGEIIRSFWGHDIGSSNINENDPHDNQ